MKKNEPSESQERILYETLLEVSNKQDATMQSMMDMMIFSGAINIMSREAPRANRETAFDLIVGKLARKFAVKDISGLIDWLDGYEWRESDTPGSVCEDLKNYLES